MHYDVVVIGSGFGGAVAALRFAEAGQRVLVIERGDWVTRDKFATDLEFFWLPHRDCFGPNDIQPRGKTILPWLGCAVGGGSHVYAGTLKRVDDFAGYPAAVATADMAPWYERAEAMMLPVHVPTHPPYDDNRALDLLQRATAELQRSHPDVVVEHGLVPLAVSFAPPGGDVNATFHNEHGALQRYHHPHEQSILGGDIDAKNTLDKNYLHRAVAAGATIQALTEVTGLAPAGADGWRLTTRAFRPTPGGFARWRRRWLPGQQRVDVATDTVTATRVVLSAGCVGTTELLLRARDVDQTLPALSPALGQRYNTNGNFLSLIVPLRGVALGWLGFVLMLVAWAMASWPLAAVGAAAYWGQLILGRGVDPDLGTTNSEYTRFRGEPGGKDCVFIESGRYPTPGRLFWAIALGWLGQYRPDRYRRIVQISNVVRWLIPPMALVARMWPIPLLKMGRDQATGTFTLARGRAEIRFDAAANRAYYRHLDHLGRLIAKSARALWMPNLLHRLTGKLEVPHNQGGAPMADRPEDGVVDHAGRVYGYDNLMVLDGSMMPTSPGPNPALTILALSERAMSIAVAQLQETGTVRAAAPDVVSAA